MINIGLGLVQSLIEISQRAGNEIMKVYDTDFKIEIKGDASPVTSADKISEALILRSIREGITDKFPIVGEEAATEGNISNVKNIPFWLVDPLDGTKEFIKRNGQFTVNIALIENNTPVLGIIHAPAKNKTYWGSIHGCFTQAGSNPPVMISCRNFPCSNIKAVVSRSHITPKTDTYLTQFTELEKIGTGSSLKFCMIAEGSADLYPRFGRTMEWDTAAGHAIIKYAGGNVRTINGEDLSYGKKSFENPDFIASGPGFEIKN